MERTDPLIQAVRETLSRYAMVARGSRVLVAVSGGVDSVVLLVALEEALREDEASLSVCYVHHGLRAAADDEADFVSDLARRRQAPFLVERVDVPGLRSPGESTEEAARRLRYQALARAAARVGADRIALGHHRDDQVETVLMRILAGTGPDGLAGIPPVRGPIIRPLIHRTRREIKDYARRLGLEHRTDESNLDTTIRRNRVRLELLPYLEREFNPRVREALWRLSMLIADEADWSRSRALEAEAGLRRDHHLFQSVPAASLAADSLAALPAALQRRILRQTCRRVMARAAGGEDHGLAGEGREGMGYDEVEALRSLLARPGGRAVDLPRDLRARRTPKHLHIFHRHLEKGVGYRYVLPVPGICRVPEAGLVLRAWREGGTLPQPCSQGSPEGGESVQVWRMVLGVAAGLAPSGLTVRSPAAGDRVRMPGADAARRLRAVLASRGLPVPVRGVVPVVVHGREIAAVVPLGATGGFTAGAAGESAGAGGEAGESPNAAAGTVVVLEAVPGPWVDA